MLFWWRSYGEIARYPCEGSKKSNSYQTQKTVDYIDIHLIFHLRSWVLARLLGIAALIILVPSKLPISSLKKTYSKGFRDLNLIFQSFRSWTLHLSRVSSVDNRVFYYTYLKLECKDLYIMPSVIRNLKIYLTPRGKLTTMSVLYSWLSSTWMIGQVHLLAHGSPMLCEKF